MDFTRSFAISAAGMTAERTRVEVAALNLANANTIQQPGGTAFHPLRATLRSLPAALAIPSAFSAQVTAGLDEQGALSRNLDLPQVSVEPSGAEPRAVYEPGNPFANSKGYITYPGVDTAAEMLNMMSAVRSYEANVAAMNTSRTMALKALEIGGTSA